MLLGRLALVVFSNAWSVLSANQELQPVGHPPSCPTIPFVTGSILSPRQSPLLDQSLPIHSWTTPS